MSDNKCIEALQKALLDFECNKIQGVELVRIFDDRIADDFPDDLEENVAEIYHDLHTALALYTPDPSEQGGYYIGNEKLSVLVKDAVEKLKIDKSRRVKKVSRT